MTLDEWNDEMGALSGRWHRWRRTPFPSGWAWVEMDGVELVLIDADMAALIDSVLTRGPLRPSGTDALVRLADQLRAVLPHLSGDATAYFTELVNLADLTVSLSKSLPQSTTNR